MARTYLSSDLCIKEAFNPETSALDVSIKDTAIGFSLNEKEDSITSVCKTICAEMKANEMINVSGLKQLTVYAQPGTSVKVSPVLDKDIVVSAGIIPESGFLTLNLCAMRICLSADGHLVGV